MYMWLTLVNTFELQHVAAKVVPSADQMCDQYRKAAYNILDIIKDNNNVF